MTTVDERIKTVCRQRDWRVAQLQAIAEHFGYDDIAHFMKGLGLDYNVGTTKQPVYGLDCGVDMKTGKGVCVCGRCSAHNTHSEQP